jgi:release factor glutamine methyltransferase
MLFESAEYPKVKASFSAALSHCFSSSEIRLMWRETLLYFFGMPRHEQMTASDLIFSSDQCELLEQVIRRIKSGEPFQYLIGEVEFMGLSLQIDPRALIPRPETEELSAWIIEDHQQGLQSILDVCSGSGCLSLALSDAFEKAQVLGVDASFEAVQLAEENALALKLPVVYQKVDVLDLEAFSECLVKTTKSNGLFDVVVANPPYIPEHEKTHMELNVLDHEPAMALFVPDNDPVLFYRSIAKSIAPYLSTKGSLYFECHYLYLDATRDLLIELGYKNVEKRKDLQGKWRLLKAQKS